MKTFFMLSCALCPLLMLHSLAVSCERLGEEASGAKGKLCVSFDPNGNHTRAGTALPDTCDFILEITDSHGRNVYEGAYGDCPETLELDAGSYTVRAVSCEFVKPAFDMPQYGDEQCVVIPAGGRADVRLVCTQINAGISLDVDEEFLTHCPDAVLFLKSSAGRLMYSYSEKRTAYFPPGTVSLIMSGGESEETVMTRELAAREMVVVKVSVAAALGAEKNSISMSVDTSRVWSVLDCVIGGNGGQGSSAVLTVAQAMSSSGKKDVWVSGYVVGGDLTTSSASFSVPFKSRTNLLLGPRSSTTDKEACVSVQLPEGDVRDRLNLVDNPHLLKRRICLKGDIVGAYFGITGIKNTSEYNLM